MSCCHGDRPSLDLGSWGLSSSFQISHLRIYSASATPATSPPEAAALCDALETQPGPADGQALPKEPQVPPLPLPPQRPADWSPLGPRGITHLRAAPLPPPRLALAGKHLPVRHTNTPLGINPPGSVVCRAGALSACGLLALPCRWPSQRSPSKAHMQRPQGQRGAPDNSDQHPLQPGSS